MSGFHFLSEHRPGKEGTKPDTLACPPEHQPQDSGDARAVHQNQIVLKQYNLGKGVSVPRRFRDR